MYIGIGILTLTVSIKNRFSPLSEEGNWSVKTSSKLFLAKTCYFMYIDMHGFFWDKSFQVWLGTGRTGFVLFDHKWMLGQKSLHFFQLCYTIINSAEPHFAKDNLAMYEV